MSQKLFDSKQVVQASLGVLGGMFGTPMGVFGEWAQYAPNKYFDPGDYYSVADYYDGEAYFSSKNIMREAMDGAANI
jgi:hypothetical protein